MKGIQMLTDGKVRKEEFTLDELVYELKNTWITRVRDGQLYAFHSGSLVLTWARENEDDFRTYCKHNTVKGQELETLVVELMLAGDADGEVISRERRAEYGDCIGWFADRELCPETDPGKAVALARREGRITGIARAFRRRRTSRTRRLRLQKIRPKPQKRLDANVAQKTVSLGLHLRRRHASLPNGWIRSRPSSRELANPVMTSAPRLEIATPCSRSCPATGSRRG
jgi:hypothetical protein